MSTCLICLNDDEAKSISLSQYYNCECKAKCHLSCLEEWSSKSNKCLQCRKYVEVIINISLGVMKRFILTMILLTSPAIVLDLFDLRFCSERFFMCYG